METPKETIYRKVAVSVEPKRGGDYFTDLGKSYFNSKTHKWEDYYKAETIHPEFWLEEIEETQLQKDKEDLTKLKSTIEDFRDRARKSAEDMNSAGLETSGISSQAMEFAYKNCLIEIESLIQKHKQ